MVIRDGNNAISISPIEWGPRGLPAAGDVHLDVEVSSQGFKGRASVWVEAAGLQSFLQQLRQLEERREGAAELLSMSPDELALQIRSVNRRGHMAVAGRLARIQYIGEKAGYLHALEFGFEFDPTTLGEILRTFEGWVTAPG